jgi:hypothetical protein
MVLISLTDVNRVVMRDGKVGTEAECLCKCCNCSACECEVDVTYGGITFPADGQEYCMCISNGPLWMPGPFGNVQFGIRAMLSVSAVLECYPFGETAPFGANLSQFWIRVKTRYSQIDGDINGLYPDVGDVCDFWIQFRLAFTSFQKTRIYQWSECDECGCPANQQPILLDGGSLDQLADGPNVPCINEYNHTTRTDPSFDISCGICP